MTSTFQLLRVWLGIALLFAFVGCSTAAKKTPLQAAPPSAKQELNQASIELAGGGEKRAVARLKSLIAKNAGTDVADDATLILARHQFAKNQFELAYQNYMSLVNGQNLSPNEGEALLGAAKCLHRLGRLDEALSLNARGIKIQGLNSATQLELHRQRYSLLNVMGDRLDALRTLAYLHRFETSPEVRNQALSRGLDLVQRFLVTQDLEKVINDANLSFVRSQAAYRLAQIQLTNKDFDSARSLFMRAAEWGAGTQIQKSAESYVNQIDSRRRVEPYTIGAVLPLTGKHAPIAQKTLRGLQFGLGLQGNQKSAFKLAVMDSEGTPEGATRAVERLISEDNVIAVVGSLLSRTASSVATKTEELGIPSIALSQKAGLTEQGTMTFRNALTSRMQVRELVRVAMDQLGLKAFAILFPNDSYGVEYANLFWDEVLSRGGKITGAQPYSPSETDFRGPIRRLVGTYYTEDRKVEYQGRVKEWFKKQKSIKTRNTPPDDLLPPVIDFDAIFIPDSPKAMGQIAPMLAYQGVTNVRLIGTNIWNTPDLIRRGQKNIEGAIFVDSTLNTDPNFRTTPFATEYKKIFGEDPGLFEVQGYEAGVLLRQLIEGGERTRLGLAQSLANTRQFNGVMGPLVANNEREWIRPLQPLTVRNGEIVLFSK